jgi:broad specificity phosphatase PhoE
MHSFLHVHANLAKLRCCQIKYGMQIVLFRHAEKDLAGGSNPPLSRRGLAQAQKLIELVKIKTLPRPSKLLTSPRLRAQMTLSPLAETMDIDFQITPELDERIQGETSDQFSKRVQRFLRQIENQTGLIFLCSHLDWIEEALREIRSDQDLLNERYASWPSCQYMSFQVQDRLWHLENFERIQI